MEYLSSLYDEYQHNRDLKATQALRNKSIYIIPGSGSRVPRAIFIALNPTIVEYKNRRPISGKSGDVFERMLNKAGILRSDIFITHIVKYYTQAGREPTAQEINEALPYLRREIAILGRGAYRTIVTIGPSVPELLFDEPRIDGSFFVNGWRIFNIEDPRVVIPQKNSAEIRKLQSSLNEIGNYVNSLVD